MGLTCNIDARGKRTRLVMGIVQLVVAVGIAGGVGFADGIEGWVDCGDHPDGHRSFPPFSKPGAGWCALRAMGVKTRI